jgi:hypothetical protein
MNQAFGSPLESLPVSPLDLVSSESDSVASTPEDIGNTAVFQKVEDVPAGTHSPDTLKGNNINRYD